ncbi:PREDICTED: zinc-finger homeodomain protein 3-like [Erythranthe guttata]|nr:PREDICTED: zinc-finger homeodomain protein 3-like [Erythranthe guttata]|eukprot:XP_012837642.1 PREDICTED: zinc-finger homeodomain protein 3-like [Erythranthe guttata]
MATDNSSKVEMLVMYKECMHNPADSNRDFLHDGCGLFEAPSGTTTRSREAMFRAVCGCHRNFHRRIEVEIPPRHRSSRSSSIRHHQQQQQPSLHPHQPQQPASHHHHHRGRFAPKQVAARRQRRALAHHVEGTSAAAQEVPPQHGVRAPCRKRITRAQSEMVRALTERNDWKMFRE